MADNETKQAGAGGGTAGAGVVGLETQDTNAKLAAAGSTQTTGAEKQIKSIDPNGAETGTRETPTGEVKDTSKATAGADDPYTQTTARHVDPNDPNAPTALDLGGAGTGDQKRSDYSFGQKPAKYPNETQEDYEARLEALSDADRRKNMTAEERMKEAGTHPDDLGDDASDEQKQKAKSAQLYERIKDVFGKIQEEITDHVGARAGAIHAKLDEALAEMQKQLHG